MINRTTIQNALYAWAAAATGMTVIWSDEDGPRPDMPYVSLRIPTIARGGVDFVGRPGADGNAKVLGNRDITVFARGFGPGTLEALEALATSIERPSVQDPLRAAGLAVVGAFPVVNLSEKRATKFEEKASVDFQFRTGSEVLDQVGLIEHVEIEATLDRPAPTPDLVHTFTVDAV